MKPIDSLSLPVRAARCVPRDGLEVGGMFKEVKFWGVHPRRGRLTHCIEFSRADLGAFILLEVTGIVK